MADIPNVAGAQIMGTVGINYTPAIEASKQCVTALDMVNVALKNTQNVAKQYGNVFANDLGRQVSGQGLIYDRYGNILSQVNKKMHTATQEAANQAKTIKDLANSHTFLQHRMGWFLSGAIFYGAQDVFRDTLRTIGEVEMGMVEISRISNDATADFKQMRQELFDLGIEFGSSWEQVQDIALRWSQAGYNVRDTLELTRSSLAALNTAELDATNATQSMIGIMSQWQLQADQLLPLIDKINITADNFSITSQDVVDGLLRSSAAARTLGLSLEQTIGLITAMREASGRTGREVGNALNTILTYITRPSTINTLEASGIEVYANKARTAFRPLNDMLTDIAYNWNSFGEAAQQELGKMAKDTGLVTEEMAKAVAQQGEWNDLLKRDISMSVAGTRRRTYFIALLQNFARTQEVVNNMENSFGYSMQENERTMETYQAKVQQLHTAFQMLAVEIGEAGLLDAAKGFTDEIRSWIELFEKLPPELQRAIILLGETAGSLALVNLASRTFLSIGLGQALINLAANVAKVKAETLSLGAAIKIIAGSPIARFIALLSTGVIVLREVSRWQAEANQRINDSIQKSLDAANKAKTQANEIKKLSDEYEKYAMKSNRSTEENERLQKVTDELIRLMPGLAAKFDEAKSSAEQYSGVIAYTREELKKLNSEMKENIGFAANVAENNIQNTKQQLDELRKQQKELRESYNAADPVEALFKLHIRYDDRVLDNISVKSPFISQEEKIERAKDAIANWEKEISEEYEATKRLYEKQKQTIEMRDKIQLENDTSDPNKPIGGSGIPSGGQGTRGETAAQAYERLNTERESLLHQMKIGEISTAQYLASLKRIEKQMRAAGVEEGKIWAIQEEIASLQNKSGKAYEKLLKQQDKETKQFYDDSFNYAMRYYQHVNSMARSSRNEQIRYLQDLSKAHEWEKEKMWSLEEEIFRLYQDELRDQQDSFEKSYQERINKIEEESKALEKAIQAKIDALDREQEKDNREESERQHYKKIEDLQKEKRYHELRTGREHEKAIVEIEQELEEENRRWQQQLDDWEREDKKENLEKQLEEVKNAAEEEKRIWKQKYDDIKAKWDEWSDNFASAAMNDPKWLAIGKAIGSQISDGFSQSIDYMDSLLDDIDTSTPEPGGGFSGGNGINFTDADGNYYVRNPDGSVTKYYASQYKDKYGESVTIPANDPRMKWVPKEVGGGYTLPKAHIGAYVQKGGIAELKHDERVLSPKLNFQFERLVAALQTGNLTPKQNTRTVQIGTLFNVEHVKFEDEQDMEIMSREIGREIERL